MIERNEFQVLSFLPRGKKASPSKTAYLFQLKGWPKSSWPLTNFLTELAITQMCEQGVLWALQIGAHVSRFSLNAYRLSCKLEQELALKQWSGKGLGEGGEEPQGAIGKYVALSRKKPQTDSRFMEWEDEQERVVRHIYMVFFPQKRNFCRKLGHIGTKRR